MSRGRPRKMTLARVAQARTLITQGYALTTVARTLAVDRVTLWRALQHAPDAHAIVAPD